MLNPLVKRNQFERYLDIISVEDVKQFKPTSAAYSCVLDRFSVHRKEVLSFNPWDISGANNFGFRTAWVNRQNGICARYSYPGLNRIAGTCLIKERVISHKRLNNKEVVIPIKMGVFTREQE
ncbi:hypothetical protein GCM10008935_02330 [Alkalibacillus silvisoli]|uniref:RES domain-containing protein n=1 Tax=Alkalibacillus silvisoli TaxID=392823 RepID=A0ABN0ZL34_9BACI